MSDDRRQEAIEAGERIGSIAWDWLSHGHPEAEPTTYRKVFAALQCIMVAQPDGDADMAFAALGAILARAHDVDRAVACFNQGFAAAVETDALEMGTMQ